MQGLCSLISHFKCVPFDTVYASKKPVAFWELYTWAKCARLRSPPARRDAGASGTSKFEGLSKILRTISTKTVGNNWCSNPWISKMCKPENTSSRDRIPLQPKRWNQQATRSIWRWQEMINKNRFNFIVKQILLLRLLEIPWGLQNLLKMSQCRTTVTLKQRHSGGSGDVAAGPEVPRERCEAGNWHSWDSGKVF